MDIIKKNISISPKNDKKYPYNDIKNFCKKNDM